MARRENRLPEFRVFEHPVVDTRPAEMEQSITREMLCTTPEPLPAAAMVNVAGVYTISTVVQPEWAGNSMSQLPIAELLASTSDDPLAGAVSVAAPAQVGAALLVVVTAPSCVRSWNKVRGSSCALRVQ